jgi:hypothetical protein
MHGTGRRGGLHLRDAYLDHGITQHSSLQAFSGDRSTVMQEQETRNAVPLMPLRTLLRARILPLWRSTMDFEIASPNPVPCSFLVVKNGSKILCRMVSGMPCPSSATIRWTSRLILRTRMVSLPLSGGASIEFERRLDSTWSNSPACPMTTASAGMSLSSLACLATSLCSCTRSAASARTASRGDCRLSLTDY